MNARARDLGMSDTRYVEPTGLSSRNQSSAKDLATLVAFAANDPMLRELLELDYLFEDPVILDDPARRRLVPSFQPTPLDAAIAQGVFRTDRFRLARLPQGQNSDRLGVRLVDVIMHRLFQLRRHVRRVAGVAADEEFAEVQPAEDQFGRHAAVGAADPKITGGLLAGEFEEELRITLPDLFGPGLVLGEEVVEVGHGTRRFGDEHWPSDGSVKPNPRASCNPLAELARGRLACPGENRGRPAALRRVDVMPAGGRAGGAGFFAAATIASNSVFRTGCTEPSGFIETVLNQGGEDGLLFFGIKTLG